VLSKQLDPLTQRVGAQPSDPSREGTRPLVYRAGARPSDPSRGGAQPLVYWGRAQPSNPDLNHALPTYLTALLCTPTLVEGMSGSS